MASTKARTPSNRRSEGDRPSILDVAIKYLMEFAGKEADKSYGINLGRFDEKLYIGDKEIYLFE